MSSHVYQYNSDCKQPDPEIWGGGAAGGPLLIVSGLDFSQKLIKKYVGDLPTLNFSSLAQESIFKNYIGDLPTFKLSSSIEESVRYNPPEDNVVLSLQGQSINYFISNEVVDEITSLEYSGFITEKTSYNYSNPFSDVELLAEDNGLITDPVTSISNYGTLTAPVEEHIDCGTTEITESTAAATGLIEITGSSSNSAFVKEINTVLIQSYGACIEQVSYIPPIDEDTFENNLGSSQATFDNTTLTFDSSEPKPNIKLTGNAVEIVISNTPEEKINIQSDGICIEKVRYDYSIIETSPFITETSGLITDPVTLSIDYGLITSPTSLGNEDLGLIINTQPVTPFGSIGIITGSAHVRPPDDIRTYNASGEYRVTYSPDDTTGSLFGFGEKIEAATYDYNVSSADILETFDEGLITDTPTVTVDYGFIIDSDVSEQIDYNTIEIVSSNLPFGLFSVNGSANTEWINKNFSASGEYRVTYSPDDTTGSLFGFGTKDESVVYDYSEQTILLVGDPDYGQISTGSTTFDDYGYVIEIHSQTDDLGFVVGFPAIGDVYPYGTITISGDGSESLISQTPDQPILITIDGVKEERVSYSYTNRRYDNTLSSNNITYDSTLETFDASEQPDIKVTGSAELSPVVYTEIGSGSLFGIGILQESVTYDYDVESLVVLSTTDSGLITDSPTLTVDYGFITDPVSAQDDDGLISDTETLIPFGLLSINGSANTEWINVNIYNSPEAEVSFTYSPDNTSGTLFGFGEKLESVSYVYSENSVLIVGDPDYGNIAIGYTRIDDYGLVSEIHSQTLDLGFVVGFPAIDDVYPYGSITVLGSAEESYTSNQIYTGLFNIYGTAGLDYTPEFTSQAGPLVVSGSAHVSFVSNDPTTGTLVQTGTLTERRTKSYNESSILTSSEQLFDYGDITSIPTALSADYGYVYEEPNENTEELGVIYDVPTTLYPFGTINISGAPLLHPEVDYTPAYTGSGLITISGSALESETDDFGSDRRRGGNIRYCGDAETREIANYGYYGDDNDPGTSGSIFINGTLIESETDSYVGIGTLVVSDSGIERDAESYVGLGTASFSGVAIESFTGDTPEGTQLFSFYGELNHPQIDYTPHYGIEKNIGVGTTGIQISGTALESESETYIGLGTIFTVNGLSPQDTEAYPGGPSVGRSWSYTRATYIAEPISLNISTGVALTHYYSPIYPRNALGTDPSSGIGTIRINDDKGLAFTRAVLPIFAKGKIYLLGIGTAGNGDLDGVEIGATESFTPATEVGTGLFNISGISATREINVYQGYQTTGVITISQQTKPIIEKYTASWVGFGTVFVSDNAVERDLEAYFGSGTILAVSGVAEAYSAQTPEDTATLQISGSAQESFVAQTPEDTVLYTFSGAATDEKLIKAYEGSGSTILSGSANVTSSPAYPASGTIRFANTHHVDNLYDTCDSVDITSDEQDSAYVSFTANPPEDTVLFVIGGNAVTSETALYTEFVSGLYTLSGTYQNLKLTHSESGIGTIFITETSSESEREVYVGSGSLFTISGATEFYSAQVSTSTVVLQISGSAITSTEAEYSTVGIGLFTFNGTAITSEIATYTQTASGSITLSGQLVYPDIIFIPSPDGSGTINVLGSSDNSLTKVYEDTSGVLFTFSSGLESFTKSTYVGLGTVYIEEISGTTIDNPYQIPRTYVCII